MSQTIQLRRDTAANWAAANPVLAQGEAGIVTDAGDGEPNARLGNGTTAWADLGWWSPGGAVVDSVNGQTGAVELTAADVSALPAAGGTVGGELSPTVTTLAFASTVEVNAALGNVFSLSMTGACTLADPTGGTDGQAIRLRLTSNGHALTYGGAYQFGSAGQPTLSSSGLDVLGFEFVAALSAWVFLGGGGQGF